MSTMNIVSLPKFPALDTHQFFKVATMSVLIEFWILNEIHTIVHIGLADDIRFSTIKLYQSPAQYIHNKIS